MSDPFQIDDDDMVIEPDHLVDKNMSSAHDSMQDVEFNADTSVSGNMTTQPVSSPKKSYNGGPFSLNYYRRYFDISTLDFFKSCYRSLNPLSKLDSYEFQEVGDLYGPIWVTATLIFLLFFCNSFAELLSSLGHSKDDKDVVIHVNYFKIILSSINLLYGYTFLVPTVLWAVLKFYLKVANLAPLTRLISIYAYANLLWVPAAVLSIFRGLLSSHHFLDGCLKWGCILLGCVLSGCSILVKLNQYFHIVFSNENAEEQKKHILLLISLLAIPHLGFALAVKVAFFGTL